jgi:chemotaxis protein MotA
MAAGKGPDFSVLIGIGCGAGALLFGFLFEGGNPLALVGISALIIIIGGTTGALITSFSVKDVLLIPKYVGEALTSAEGPDQEIVDELCEYSEKARRDGILSLEDRLEEIKDPYLRKGLQFLVDGVEPETIQSTLENDIFLFEHKVKEKAAIFDAAGGFSPTMGIVGTVMGLVLVLQGLGGNAEEMGKSIAVAFIATLYGIGFANLVWLPIGNNFKNKLKTTKLRKELIMFGILGIQQGENPGLLRSRLISYLE